jgi:hypothetical protein
MKQVWRHMRTVFKNIHFWDVTPCRCLHTFLRNVLPAYSDQKGLPDYPPEDRNLHTQHHKRLRIHIGLYIFRWEVL